MRPLGVPHAYEKRYSGFKLQEIVKALRKLDEAAAVEFIKLYLER